LNTFLLIDVNADVVTCLVGYDIVDEMGGDGMIDGCSITKRCYKTMLQNDVTI
jgi:hypothetical protein